MKKKLISTLMASTMLLSSGTTLAYNDTNNHWAETYINNMDNAGVLGQFEEDNIYPDRPMTRGECAVLISDFAETYFNYKPTYREDNYKFPDLTDEEKANKIRALSLLTYRSYMTAEPFVFPYVSEAKIINGYPTGTFELEEFKPYNTVTRAEFSKMFMNTIDCFGYMNIGNIGTVIQSDANDHWAFNSLILGWGYRILNGYNVWHDDFGNTHIEFKPDNNITRAEAIKMIASARGLIYIGLGHGGYDGTRPEGEQNLYYLKDSVR